MSTAELVQINGPVVKARTEGGFAMKEAVFVGSHRLAGEVIGLERDSITVQIFEDTTSLMPGEPVEGSATPLAVELGPGLLGRIFDGIQRPLEVLAQSEGNYIGVGTETPRLERDREWPFRPLAQGAQPVRPGQVLGEVAETAHTTHRVLAPPDVAGRLDWLAPAGHYTIEAPIARVIAANGTTRECCLYQRWPIRSPRPVTRRFGPEQPLLTGQRVLDTFFPIARGGAGALPGGFGTGKTVLQQTLTKWCDADVIVYIGCGERGNEMASVLDEFPQLEDPRTGRALMERTVLIANTSNMPVAAREASIYTGITLAEFFRDQGLHVALFADSISRWAEALREISGRLEELPAEEGYPAYLSSRLAEFFERAGRVQCLAGEESSVTVVATVSPPGGDFSEPVTSQCRRYVKSFWALDRLLAQARFYPAIQPLTSYSMYIEETGRWWQHQGGLRWNERRERALQLLETQTRLEKMVKIVGRDALAPEQRLTLICADVLCEGFLRQSAFSPLDRYCPPDKQVEMLNLIDRFIELAEAAVARGVDPDRLPSLPVVRRLQRMGEDIAHDDRDGFATLARELEIAFDELAPELPAERTQD